MAVDTRFKRFAMMAFGSGVGLAADIMFEADSAVDADDRAHMLNLYGGIALDSPVAGGATAGTLGLMGVGI